MKPIFSYARVNTDSATANPLHYQVLALNKLHPIDAIKVVLEQYMLAGYIKATGNAKTGDTLDHLTGQLLNELPTKLSGRFGLLSDFYARGIEIANAMAYGDYNRFHGDEVLSFFGYNTEAEYEDIIYTSTIPTDLRYQILNILCNYQNQEIFPNDRLVGCNFYAPSLRAVKLPKVYADRSNDGNVWRCVLEIFPAAQASSFESTGPLNSLLNFVERFSFINMDMLSMVALLSNFSLERYKYNMTNFGSQKKLDFQDVCFDLVKTSIPVGGFLPMEETNVSRGHLQHDLETFVRMISSGKLSPIKDITHNKGVILSLLERCGCDPKLVNYFSKPVETITGNESAFFKESYLAALFAHDRMTAGLAAAEDDNDEDEDDVTEQDGAEDTASDSSDSQGDAPNEEGEAEEDMDFTEGDEAADPADEDSSDETEPDKVDKRPEIDPKFMLLELSSPAETLSDYLYRDLVSRRISYILKNPPENARPDVLQLLRAWKNQWLFIVSIPTIRDFLSRIALRIS